MKHAKFHESVYGVDVHILWEFKGQSADLDRWAMRHLGVDIKHSDGWAGRFVEGNTGVAIALMGPWTGTPEDHSALVHECMHAVHCILGDTGMRLCDRTAEAYCYLLDSLVLRCILGITKKEKKLLTDGLHTLGIHARSPKNTP